MPLCHNGWTLALAFSFLTLPGVRAQDLAEWIASLGGFVSPKLQVKYGAAGRGLFVNTSVRPAETLISVPFDAILFGEKAVKLTACQRKIRDFFDIRLHPENARTFSIFSILVFLLHISKNPQIRKTWPHLDSLLTHWDDQQLSRFPLFWTSNQLADISGTTAFEIYSIARTGVEREYHEVFRMLCPKLASGLSLQSYKKIWALVNSRILSFPESPETGLPAQPALVPMFDIVNHHLPIPQEPLETEAQVALHMSKSLGRFGTQPPEENAHQQAGLHLWLERAIEGGEEVTDVYGLQSNQEMLWTFGFTVPWIHKLTCLTKTRLSMDIEELRSLPGGAGFPHQLLANLQPFLHFELGGCAEKGFKSSFRLTEARSFLRAWVASARASLHELHKSCSFESPDTRFVLTLIYIYNHVLSSTIRRKSLFVSTCYFSLREAEAKEALAPFWLGSETGGSMGRHWHTWHLDAKCRYLTIEEEQQVLMTLSHCLQQKILAMKGSLSDDEQILKSQDLGLRFKE